jgi:hypothetical protein
MKLDTIGFLGFSLKTKRKSLPLLIYLSIQNLKLAKEPTYILRREFFSFFSTLLLHPRLFG